MLRILWKTSREGAALFGLCAALLLLGFYRLGGTPSWAWERETSSYSSQAASCPKCKSPLTIMSVQKATCTVRGHVEYNCDECNQYHEIVYEEVIPHDYEKISSEEATCTQSATVTKRCKDCNAVITEEVQDSVLGHDYQDVVTPPTCSAIGYTDHICRRCGDTYQDSHTAKIDHTYIETVEIPPTCQAVGFMRHTCQMCQHSFTEELSVVEHDWQFASLVEASHTQQGYTVYACSYCETIKRENFTEQRPYEMVWTEQEATCTANGLKIGVCADGCGHTETVVIPRLEHRFGEWMTIRNADESGAGIESRVCELCAFSEMRDIPYVPGTQKVEPVEPTPSVDKNWFALGSIAVLCVVAIIFVVVLLMLLLEHARRDRMKRSRRQFSASYSNE